MRAHTRHTPRYELVDAAEASAALPGEGEAAAGSVREGPQRVVYDRVDDIDGLERLVVVCVGLDQRVEKDAAATRSRLYRAMTRARGAARTPLDAAFSMSSAPRESLT